MIGAFDGLSDSDGPMRAILLVGGLDSAAGSAAMRTPAIGPLVDQAVAVDRLSRTASTTVSIASITTGALSIITMCPL
jgi:hypothetical protein